MIFFTQYAHCRWLQPTNHTATIQNNTLSESFYTPVRTSNEIYLQIIAKSIAACVNFSFFFHSLQHQNYLAKYL